MQPGKIKLRVDLSGYYFIGMFAITVAGFWPSYFVNFFNGTASFRFYFHFHAAMMSLWIIMLIVQPILIRKKKLQLHRFLGKLSYFLFALMSVSIILIIHQQHNTSEPNLDLSLFAQFSNFIVLQVAYVIAIRYRHNIDIHARGMIATGIALIQPGLARLLYNLFGLFKLFQDFPLSGILVSLLLIYSLFTWIIIKERHQQKGRWVFPVIFALYFVVYIIAIFQIHIGLQGLSKWFISLPLTHP